MNELAKVGATTIRRIELGDCEPRISTLRIIQHALQERGAEFGEPNWVKRQGRQTSGKNSSLGREQLPEVLSQPSSLRVFDECVPGGRARK